MKSKIMKLATLGLIVVFVATAIALPSPQIVKADPQFGSNWTAYYWNNRDFSGNPTVSRIDQAINFNWGTGSPDGAIPADNFSARWYGTFAFAAGTYTFKAGAEDGIRVALDGALIINRFTVGNAFQVDTANVTLGAGNHSFIVDFFAGTGPAGVQFSWDTQSASASVAPTPTAVGAGPANTIPVSGIRAEIISNVANVRGGPSTSFTPITQVFLGQQFALVARNGDFGPRTWYMIQLPDGRRGWIFRPLIYVFGGDPASLPISGDTVQPPAALVDVQAVANSTVIVRDGPSTRNSQKIGAISQGQTVKVLRLSRNRAWIYIDANGLRGWVFLPLLTIVSGDLGKVPVGN